MNLSLCTENGHCLFFDIDTDGDPNFSTTTSPQPDANGDGDLMIEDLLPTDAESSL